MEQENIEMTLSRIKGVVRKLLPEYYHDLDNLVNNIWLEGYKKGIRITSRHIKWRVKGYLDFINYRHFPHLSLYIKNKEGKEHIRPEVEEKASIKNNFIKDIENEDLINTLSEFLDFRQKEIFRLVLQGFTIKEIAKIFNMKDVNISYRWRNIQKILSWNLIYNKKFVA